MSSKGSTGSSTSIPDDTYKTKTTAATVVNDGVLKEDLEKGEIQEAGPELAHSLSSSSQSFIKAKISRRRLNVIVIGLCLLYFISALDMTILATVYVDISNEYRDLQNGIWIIVSYLLATTAVQPLFGKFSDILGRFEAVAAATLVFCVGSVICAAAKSMGMLVAGRAIQGIGGGGLISMVSVILSDVTSERDRGKYTGALAASWGAASAVGPVMGGAIVENASWRIIFWINLPVCVPTIIVMFFALKIPRPQGTVREKFRRMDILGSLVFQGFIIPIIIAFSWAGQGHKWISGQVLGTIFGSLAVGVIFLIVEWKVAVEPIIPLRLFKIRNVTASAIGHFCMGACVYSPITFVPLWELAVKHSSETIAGLHILPIMVAMVISATLSGIITTRFGKYRILIWLCGIFIAVGNSLLLLYKPDSGNGERIGFLAITGFGLGFGIQSLIIAAQCAVSGLDMAATTSLVLFMRTLGGIFSLSIHSSVFNNSIRDEAKDLTVMFPDYVSIINESLNDQSIIGKNNTLPTEVLLGITNMFHNALHKVFIGLIPFSALMVLSTLLFKHVNLHDKRRKTIK
ncbi:MFS general substrate transporter [Coemansia reversa NRRL 1564]|uniref:MFS general substrate transporter n=1 Tax=Coemansia reversa (strain ATCC 12441 / NRRL 1564) TaxID=763665 RepID=A0A2G5B562_COERN|nr:MFS general substrate transporter [Coemansia reversa NRRL 1564]|eukprot:PIA14144.1 MFS general substrate transporter [Coemansia reversa NRRL 1564]